MTVEEIYRDITNQIVNLKILPGEKIKEEDLAKTYNVSRTPIRSTIARLEKDGLVEVRPKNGTFVTKINLAHLQASIFIRKAVEEKVLLELFEKIDLIQITRLEVILEKQKEIVDLEPSVEKSRLFLESDNFFHENIFSFANKEIVWETINKAQPLFSRLRVIANMRKKVLVSDVYNKHCMMVEAFKNKDKEALIKAYNEHLDDGFIDIEDVQKEHKEYFL